MKNLNLIKWLWDDSHEKQKMRSVRRGAAVLLLLLTCVTHAWAETIPAGTIVYVDVTNFSGTSYDDGYWMSVTDGDGYNLDRVADKSNTAGVADYWPAGDQEWQELHQVSGNLYAGKVENEQSGGKLSFWSKDESTYNNAYEVNASLAREWSSTNRKFVFESGSTWYDKKWDGAERHVSCFTSSTSSIEVFTGGQVLYVKVDNWTSDNPNFEACFLGYDGQTWVSCEHVNGNYYSATVPEGEWPYVIFVRMDPSKAAHSWDSKWTQTADIAPSGTKNCVFITSSAGAYSFDKYAPSPVLTGDFNNWSPDANPFNANGIATAELPANSAYEIKVFSGTTWYGLDNIYIYGQENTYTLNGSGASIKLHTTAVDGTYKFTWNASNNKLSIEYPDVPHPNAGYLYFLNDQGWDPVAVHVWGGIYSTTWGSNPAVSSFNWDGTDYYYVAMGDHTGAIFGQGIDDGHKTDNLTKGEDYLGKFYKKSATAGWYDFTATLTLKTNQGETTNPSPTSVTVTYGTNSNINTDVISTSPKKDGYTFGGYYTAAGGSGTQVINTSEKIPYDLSGYTTDGKWTKTGSSVSAELFAKWTQSVPLDKENGESNGSVTLTYNSASHAAITNPTKTNYTFEGWYSGDDGAGQQIINTSGVLQANKTDGVAFTGASGVWIHAGSAPTLHAKWSETPRTITTSSGEGGSVDAASYTAYVVTTTAISATPATGYKFDHWEVLSGSVDIDDLYSASTTITATSGGSIKAHFVYRWSIATDYNAVYEAWNCDAYPMGNFTTSSGDDFCSISISLPANTDYNFKVVDRNGYVWNGVPSGEDEVYLTYTSGNGDATALDAEAGNTNIHIHTAGAGDYTFLYNITDNEVTVTYPTSWTVTYGWTAGMPSPGTSVTASVGGNALLSGGYAAAGSDVTFSETHPTGFTFNGWYTTQDGNTAVTGMSTSDNVLDAIDDDATVYAQYTENHFDVTAVANPTSGGTVSPSSATSFGQYNGATINAYPYIGYIFSGWSIQTGGAGTFEHDDYKETNFKPTATSTVEASFTRQYAFFEGNFTKTDGRIVPSSTWSTDVMTMPMEWDDDNHLFVLHTYSTPAQLAEYSSGNAAYFYIQTSTSSSSFVNDASFKASSAVNGVLSAKNSAKDGTWSSSEHSFKITGSEEGYVILYFDGTSVWYELEYKVTYNGNSNGGGSAPAVAYYAENATPTAATNSGSLTRAGYVFNGWSTSSGINQSVTYETGATMSAMTADVTLYAVWFIRYALYGSLDNNESGNEEGMPGWSTAKNFTYDAVNSKYTVTVDLTKPNSNYKFRVLDHTDNTSWGYTTENHFVAENTPTVLSGDLDVKMATAGRGTYTLTVVENGSPTHPQVTITNPTSYSVSFGVKSVDASGSDAGDLGGSVTVSDGTNTYASESYIASGETVTVTAGSIPTGYQFAGWWSSSSYTGNAFSTENSASWEVTEAVNAYAKFEPKTYTAANNINANGGSENGQYTATYGATSIVINTEPTKAGYEVEYYARYSNGNDKIADAEGNLEEGLSGYIVDYKWIYDDDDLVLYPHWVPKTYTITLDAQLNGISGTSGSSTFTAKSGTSDYSSRTMPTKEGFTFAGYYTTAGGGVQILNANGGIVGSVTDYTDSDGKWTNTDDDLTLYAHWTDNGTYYFKGGASGNETSWNTASNWTKGQAPDDATDNVYILAPVVIPASATTSVNSVRIATNGSYTPIGGSAISADGKLTIPATAMLKVTTDVQNYDFSTSSASATTTATLHIQSASSGNGALVWGTSGTPGAAQVDFYTKSSAGGTGTGTTSDVNQYIGTPFSDESNYYNYYNSWVFQVNAAGTAWERLPMGSTMYPFVGYDVIYDGAEGHTFEMEGTLVTNADKTCTLAHTNDDDENLLANSWTAPMWIKGFEVSDFTNADAAIYIFNSTCEDDSDEDEKATGGNYNAYTPGTSDAYIPSMQSFSVLSSGGEGSVKLDYTDLVLDPASHSHIGAMHAPRRVESEEPENEMTFLRLRVDDENGWADELKIYIREDFVYDFENGFDARKMYGDERAPMLYGISTDGMMAIHCIPTAENQVVGFHAGTASSEYTFRFTYDGEEELYLKDTKLNTLTLIDNENSYHFYSAPSDSDMRFIIVKNAPQNPTGVDKLGTDANVQKIMHDGVMYILRGGRIYDATGALVK